MSHNPSVLFLCNFNISFEYLRILILFLSKMAMHSSSHSWPKNTINRLCSPSRICAFFAWMLIIFYNRMLPVFFTLMIALFGNFTVGSLQVSFMYVHNIMSSMHQ